MDFIFWCVAGCFSLGDESVEQEATEGLWGADVRVDTRHLVSHHQGRGRHQGEAEQSGVSGVHTSAFLDLKNIM